MEATATWIGAKALGERDYLEHQRFHKMEPHSFLSRSLDSLQGYQRYRAGAFVRYIEERYGADAIKETWKRLSLRHLPLQAINEVLHKAGTSLGEVYFDFAIQYAYAREPQWLQQTMQLKRNVPEITTTVVRAGMERAMKTVQGDHLSGGAFRIAPERRSSGTLKLGFDWSRSDDAWRVRLLVEKRDGNIIPTAIAPPTQEYEVASFGEDVKGVVIVAANTSLLNDSAVLQLSYQLVTPTADTTPPEVTITDAPRGEIDYNNVALKWTGSDDQTQTGELVYSYYLEGYDRAWSDWTSETTKEYSDLRDGSYTFRVKAKDQAGNVTPVASEVSFTIAKQVGQKGIPSRLGYVSDYAGVIDELTEAQLNALLKDLEERTTAEVVVLTVKTTAPLDIYDYGMEVYDRWKIGQDSLVLRHMSIDG